MIAARRFPLAATLGMEPHSHAEVSLHAHLAGHGEDLAELRELFDDQNDALAEPFAGECRADEQPVLVAVADDESLGAAHHRQRGEQLGLAPSLDAELIGRTRVEDLLDDFTEL